MTVEVGIRELRAKLSSYLDRVKAGEDVIVTERGRPVARISAPDGMDTLARLIAEGRVTPARRPKTPIDLDKLPRMRDGGSLSDIVIEQRRSSRY